MNYKLTLTLFFGLSFFQIAKAQTPTFTTLNLDSTKNIDGFEVFQESVDSFNVFFTGENHTFRVSNIRMQVKMLRYLHEKAGVRHLFLEFGYSRGNLVNQYVQTGDTNIINFLEANSYNEYGDFYRKLFEFNSSLDSSEKIQVHGIDMERGYETSVHLMNQLCERHKSFKAPDSIALHIESIKSLDAYIMDRALEFKKDSEGKTSMDYYSMPVDKFNVYGSVRLIRKNFKKYEDDYEAFLGDDFAEFKRIIDGLEANVERSIMDGGRTIQERIYREQFMYNQFTKLLETYPNEKFFGQFGRCHTTTAEEDEWCEHYHFKSLANRITSSEHPRLKNKVMAIATFYPKSDYYQYGKGDMNVENLVELAQEEDGKVVATKVYEDSTYFSDLYGKFDYVIINKKSINEDFKDLDNEDENYNIYGSYSYYGGVNGLYNLSFYKWDDFNSFLSSLDASEMVLPFVSYGAEYSILENEWNMANFGFYYSPTIKNQLGDSLELSIDYWMTKVQVMTEPTLSEMFNFGIGMEYGFGKLGMTTDETVPAYSNGIFTSNHIIEKYNNWFFTLGAVADFRMNFSFVNLGVRGGYQWDISNKKWTSDYRRIDESPRTSMSAFFVSPYVGFYFGG